MNALRQPAEFALGVAREAARTIMEIYSTDFAVDFKIGDDPVTTADKRASEIILKQLAREFPSATLISEEAPPPANWTSASHLWFIDPVDGTRDFVLRNGEFCVMIGLAVEGKAALGVILAPTTGEAFIGIVGDRAYEVVGDTWTPLAVSTCANPHEARVMVSRSRTKDADPFVKAFGAKSTRILGSAGLKAVEVARGRAEAYVQLNGAGCKWDACGPEALVVAAGGRLTDATGAEFDYRQEPLENKRGMIFSNAHLHDSILATLQGMTLTNG